MFSGKISASKTLGLNLWLSPELVFIISSLVVNGGNYLYNMFLGRYLGPEAFAEAGLIVTMLLVISFLGMTFQIVTAKFIVELDLSRSYFYHWMKRSALGLGIACSTLTFVFADQLALFFQTSNSLIFQIFAISFPFYFLMSVRRGVLQGMQQYKKLSATYQGEMWSRLILTFLMLLSGLFYSSVVVTLGVTASIILGYFFSGKAEKLISNVSGQSFSPETRNMVLVFVMGTVLYELTQIMISYGDLLMVKHYMDAKEAGLYTSLALVGRIIYFVAWMFVMLLLPDVVNKKKTGIPHEKVLLKYVLLITVFSGSVVFGCYLFPELVIGFLFGEAYSSVEPFLWKYGLATSFFAIANVFIYYFLALNKYVPLYLALAFALLQLILYTFFNSSISQVVNVQIITMGALVVTLLVVFIIQNKKAV